MAGLMRCVLTWFSMYPFFLPQTDQVYLFLAAALLYFSIREQYEKLYPRVGRTWFKRKPTNFVNHECRIELTLECHLLGIMLAAIENGRGFLASFPVNDIGLVLAPETCPDQSQAFKEVNNSQAFTVGRKKATDFLSERAASRCAKACLFKCWRK